MLVNGLISQLGAWYSVGVLKTYWSPEAFRELRKALFESVRQLPEGTRLSRLAEREQSAPGLERRTSAGPFPLCGVSTLPADRSPLFRGPRGACCCLHSLPLGLMSSPTSPSAATKAHQFNKLLNQKPSSSSRIRTPEDAEEALKKLRRLVLVNGIPSEVVSTEFVSASTRA